MLQIDSPAPAIVLAGRYYMTSNGKTAHGLVRGSTRFSAQAVVASNGPGGDAGEALDGKHRGIPLVGSLEQALAVAPAAQWAIIGAATHGGVLEPVLRAEVLAAVRAGLGIVNGLHDATGDDEEIASAAQAAGVSLVDLRRPRRPSELHMWHGTVMALTTPRIAVLGTDCGIGKRTTARLLVETLTERGERAEMIFTGQTGWLQGGRYGFVLDATLNDFVAGEMEHAIVSCVEEAQPDVIVIEGQSALRNPSGPCGAELLLSAGARGVVLQHAPARSYYSDFEALQLQVPTLASEIALIRHYGAEVLAVTLNPENMTPAALREWREAHAQDLGCPIVDVLAEGLEPLMLAIDTYLAADRGRA